MKPYYTRLITDLRLMGLRVDGSVSPKRGASLTTADAKECGEIRSSIVSPRFGPIALGMVRREVSAGDIVTVTDDETSARAEVTALPFGA